MQNPSVDAELCRLGRAAPALEQLGLWSEVSLSAPAKCLAHLLLIRPEPGVEQGVPGNFFYFAHPLFLGQFRRLPSLVEPPVAFADRHPPGLVHFRQLLKFMVDASRAGHGPAYQACQMMSFELLFPKWHGSPGSPKPQSATISSMRIATRAVVDTGRRVARFTADRAPCRTALLVDFVNIALLPLGKFIPDVLMAIDPGAQAGHPGMDDTGSGGTGELEVARPDWRGGRAGGGRLLPLAALARTLGGCRHPGRGNGSARLTVAAAAPRPAHLADQLVR